MKRPRDHAEWVAARDKHFDMESSCRVCGSTYGAVVHHYGRHAGTGRKDHTKLATLCFNHHTGPEGVHPLGRQTFRARFGDVFKEGE